jgi:formate dehydrogenase subunit gamma
MAPVDWEWLRRADRRRARLAVGKFNGGQKLAAAVIAGAGLVLLLTGVLLIAPARVDLPVGVRQGATIVHDLFSFGLVVLLAGHVWLAWSHPESRRALRTGAIDRRYAEREYAGWAAEVARRGGGQVVDGGRAAEEQGSADKGRQNKGRPNNGPLGERPTARQGPVR